MTDPEAIFANQAQAAYEASGAKKPYTYLKPEQWNKWEKIVTAVNAKKTYPIDFSKSIVEAAIIGRYDIEEGRYIWVDEVVAKEITRRILVTIGRA